jgi:hypothetical protein
MRRPVLAVVAAITTVLVVGCQDLRDFQGSWRGARVGETAALRVGFADEVTADLTIASIDRHGLSGRLTIPGVIDDAAVQSLAGAEADTLADITFPGNPLRVYLTFVAAGDAGDALALIALYDDERIELRILRGGSTPLYGIFALTSSPDA